MPVIPMHRPDPPAERAHAYCAPSSADRWVFCPGSVAMEATEPDSVSEAAAEGTLAHTWFAQLLQATVTFNDVPEDMREPLKLAVDFVETAVMEAQTKGAQVEMLVEQKLPLQDVTGERGATGTGDVVLILRWPTHAALHVIDLKYGRGVEVEDDTLQLPVYALAAMAKFGLMDDFTEVMTTVVQPRIRTDFATVVHTMEGIRKIGELVGRQARLALAILEQPATALSNLQVTEKGCRFCKAQAKCPAKAKQVHDTVYGELQDLTQEGIVPIDETTPAPQPGTPFEKLLPVFMARVPEIEAWCSYVRAAVEARLIQGQPVAGFKLVTGRAGPRKWTSQDEVLPVLLINQIPREIVMTPPELRSPADLEKKLKSSFPNVWHSLKAFIVQAPGKPSVAPASDKRVEYSGSAFTGESYDSTGLV